MVYKGVIIMMKLYSKPCLGIIISNYIVTSDEHQADNFRNKYYGRWRVSAIHVPCV